MTTCPPTAQGIPISADEPVRPVNLSKADIATPALVLDLDAFEFNLKTLADYCRSAGCGFRPHTKTHKCPEIARRQVQSGALGVCAATIWELEAMVAAGIPGVLLTSPIIEPPKIRRVIQLLKQGGDLMAAVGHAYEIDALAKAADDADVTLRVLIDLDVGDRRTGILPGEPALELARRAAGHKSLRLTGLQAYAGHASHTVGFEDRQRVSREAMGQAVETRKLLEKAGFAVEILSGGSTGTYNIDSHVEGVTELQVGSYVFMDVDYRRIGGKTSDVYTDFRPSLTILSTVVSTTHKDRVSIDAGTKAVDNSTTHRPEPKDAPGLIYGRFGDEFGYLTREGNGELPALGDRIEFLVPHCDPSVNLFDRIHVARGDRIEAIWPVVSGRGYS